MLKIVRVRPTEFQFLYDTEEEAQGIQRLDRFDYEGATYFIRKTVKAMDVPGCYSFLVFVK